jgi:spore germination cell wall hydrolase CwlJ-like protein
MPVINEPIIINEQTNTSTIYDEIEDIEYVAQCIEAEAGNQGFWGKVYVLDCILNRMNYYEYSSFTECINDPKQFECVSNGSIHEVEISQETWEVIEQELINQTNYDIMYFRTSRYHSFGTPMFKYGEHYFSGR